jgi:rhodanese-related sulfurtransferase
VDVRDPVSWDKSDRKIPGALREDPEQAPAWASKVAKNKTIILYCA